MSHYLAIGAGTVLACGMCWFVGHIQGQNKAELACVTNQAKANTEALAQYRAAVEAQSAEDRAQTLKDAAVIERATTKLNDSARRLEKLRAAQVPAGNCVLSPEWVKAYDEAR